ncbi:amino acid adenylation domain-containing protein [Pseudoalteromonas sp. MMG013]|uniref:non-ribosomal peptide synthetase n=1 Tax=Pseudoalteromonas sp. MMG013 TaxID=2822687 RepID=UPI001B397D6C|nr:non-ribosomal peptide synthetase [Pseudoalteromonas sp. MMG013]MBQ4861096.1 amino acid adenylation domain-containing protein [Pseudoalteromonas sp. MMG013]
MNEFHPHLYENAEKIYTELTAQGVAVQLVDNKIKVYAKENTLNERQIADLKNNRSQFIEFLSGKRKLPTIIADDAARYEPFPLTDIQRAYWVGHQMEVELADVSIHYYSEVSCASFDIAAFESAIDKTVMRHDMLRAVVDTDGNQQILRSLPPYQVNFTDLSDLSEQQQNTWLEAYRATISHSQRKPDQCPSFGFSIVRLNERVDILFASVDLLHVDGGSLMILFDDLFRFYNDASYDPSPISISYRDYALAEFSIHGSALYNEGLTYWRNEVKGLPPAPELPQLKSKPASTKFVRHQFDISNKLGSLLKQRAVELKITPTVFVMMAFSEVLKQWNSAQDFTLNVTVFNRLPMHADVNKLIGDFTSMLLLPVCHTATETLADKALRMQNKLWESMKYRHVSGVTVLSELGKHTGNQGNVQMPIVFTSMLDLGGQGLPSNWLSSFGTERFTLTQTPQVSFDHQITQLETGEMRFSWDIIDELFPATMVEDMFEVYEKMVMQLITQAGVWQQTALNILPEQQIDMLQSVNDTAIDFGGAKTLLDLVQTSVMNTPDNCAVSAQNGDLSYRQLNDAGQFYAIKLTAADVQPNAVVAILMEKGWEQIVAVLSIHHNGCAYLPIDAEQPDSRIKYQLKNSDCDVILCQSHLRQRATDLINGGLTIVVDTYTDIAVDQHDLALLRQRKPSSESLSHIIYTSGSTGKPKGVMVQHRQVVNRMLDINLRFNVSQQDKIIALTALHHDLSVYDIFGMLSAGGQLIIPAQELRLDPEHWLALCNAHPISLWNSVPAYLAIFLDYLDAQAMSSVSKLLRFFILAGDWIPVNHPQRVAKYWPDATFVASGGPTETTIWDIYNVVDKQETFQESIPYGKPLANSQYKILDCYGNACPTWVAGEMYISGAGVTPGYINQPEITDEKYVTLGHDDTRYFKSGDLGRYLPSGQIEFVGRNDHQVKIRGLRIELPEIEAVVSMLPEVDRAVALVTKTEHGPKLRLWVASDVVTHGDVVEDSNSNHFDNEEADFAQSKMAISDVSERLSKKLEYSALNPRQDTLLKPLLDQTHNAVESLCSYRDFLPRPITEQELSSMLALLRARFKEGELKCGYGSAGGLFPVQVYMHVKANRVENLEAGLYRYYPIEHALEFINDTQVPDKIHFSHNNMTYENAAISMYFVLYEPTIVPLYGDFATSMAYIEVGMMAQLLRSEGAKQNIGICQIGGFKHQDKLEATLNLTHDQVFLSSLLLGLTPPIHDEPSQVRSSDELIDKIKAHLATQLPKYMVPEEIGIIPKLPLTPNGKINRQSLLELEIKTTSRDEISLPKNHLESELAEVFKQILNIEHISTTERFFDMGANSALLVKVFHAFKSRVDLDFKLIAMFQHPTISGLIEHVSAKAASNNSDIDATEVKRLSIRRNKLKKARSKDSSWN